jgi:hypothetical protein
VSFIWLIGVHTKFEAELLDTFHGRNLEILALMSHESIFTRSLTQFALMSREITAESRWRLAVKRATFISYHQTIQVPSIGGSNFDGRLKGFPGVALGGSKWH